MSPSQIEQIGQLPAQPDETWQGDFVRFPLWVAEPGTKPYRPLTFLWTSLRAGLLGPSRDNLVAPEEKDFAMALDALVGFALDEMAGSRPGRLEVRDADLANYLTNTLSELDIDIVHRTRLPTLDSHLSSLCRSICEADPLPGYLDGKGVTVERVRAFARAAQAFHESGPWCHFSNDDLIKVESPRCGAALTYAVVLGEGGYEFGLGFYRSVEMFWDSHSNPESYSQAALEEGVWSLTFCPITEIPLADADLWEDHAMPVAGEEAHPLAILFYTSRTRRPSAKVLSFLEGLMRALAATTEEDLDCGRWTLRVTTFDGDVEYALSLPMFLDPPPRSLLYQHGFHDRRAMESSTAQVVRFLDGRSFSGIDEMNAALEKEFIGKESDRPVYPPRTALEEAQDLSYEAFESIGHRRVILARRAIEISSDCADAYVILAEAAASPQEQAELYAAGVEAGRRALGEEFFHEETEHLWARVEARPFMRTSQGLAASHALLGRIDDAIAEYRELLRLNPDDNQGNRYGLLPLLIVAGQDDETEALLAEYDDPRPVWLYARALLAFRKHGDAAESRKMLRKATRGNPSVPDFLLDEDEAESEPSDHLVNDEAAFCAEILQQAWDATPGALKWLESQR
jgi:tetratricopeptide (TPR) repeat protein